MHYRRWHKHGDPDSTLTRPNGEVFDEMYAAAYATDDACICVQGRAGHRPHVELNGVGMNASRAVWIIAHGDPGRRHVLHKRECNGGSGDNGCINIRHLYLGDHEQNMRDMVEAERQARGERGGQAQLSEEQVRQVRVLTTQGMAYSLIAARFAVSRSTVSAIHVGKRWGWMSATAA